VITTFAPERGELVVDEAVLDLEGRAVDAPAARARAPRRRPRWSRHGKGGAPRTEGAASAGGPEGQDGAADPGDAEAGPA
jgi:hypothetical protein